MDTPICLFEDRLTLNSLEFYSIDGNVVGLSENRNIRSMSSSWWRVGLDSTLVMILEHLFPRFFLGFVVFSGRIL